MIKRLHKYLAVVVILTTISGCSYLSHEPKTNYLTVILDPTDPNKLVNQFTIENLKQMLSMDSNPREGYVVTLTQIGDTRYTKSFTEVLPPVSLMKFNDIERIHQQEEFLKNLEKRLGEIKGDNREYKQSYVFSTIFDAISDQTKLSNVDSKEILVLSELGEHSSFLSVYSRKDLNILQKNPEQVYDRMADNFPIEGSGKGIRIVFCHESSQKDDQIFHITALFLKTYIQEKCESTVLIESSLDAVMHFK
jgi:hypothetical protein